MDWIVCAMLCAVRASASYLWPTATIVHMDVCISTDVIS